MSVMAQPAPVNDVHGGEIEVRKGMSVLEKAKEGSAVLDDRQWLIFG